MRAYVREREKRTVLQRSDALEGHAEVVWVQKSRGVIKKLDVLFVLLDEGGYHHKGEVDSRGS